MAATPMRLSSATIEQHIKQDIKVCNQLLDLLDQEREALKEKEIEILEGLLEKKTGCLNHLEQSAQVRTQWINGYLRSLQQNQNEEPTSETWEKMIHTLQQPELLTEWNQLKTLVKDCQTKNEVNGKVIARNQQTFGRLLNILRGQSNATSLYTSDGGKRDTQMKQQIGKA